MLSIDLDTLIERCKKNDRRAQNLLYNWLAPKLLGLCRRYFKDQSEAEDVVQDSFVKIFTNTHHFKEGNFEAWAKKITLNTALNKLKVLHRMQFDRNLNIIDTIEFNAGEVSEISEKEILSCLDDLPLGYRTILNLFLIENFSHKEIAEKLEISESTSRSQYFRAKQSLAKLLKDKLKQEQTKYA